jgi:uroporphyrinogen decarboxylase
MNKILLEVLEGHAISPAPIWVMRQAGRYLPEYRKIRTEFKNFMEFCAQPEACAEVTLQPITRFNMDAAIIFSDILLIPQALGCEVQFLENEGPILNTESPLQEPAREVLLPVYQAIKRVKEKLPEVTALIGFVGCPWTLACYMKEGRGSKDYQKARIWMQQHPQEANNLLERITDAAAEHASGQIEAGCEAIQLFDSWAGVASAAEWKQRILPATAQLISKIKHKHPKTPLIGFPKGAGRWLREYSERMDVQALSLDSTRPIGETATWLKKGMVLQGNLDPTAMFSTREEIGKQLKEIRASMQNRPHIFNLGHGILPQTDPDQLAWLIEEWRRG